MVKYQREDAMSTAFSTIKLPFLVLSTGSRPVAEVLERVGRYFYLSLIKSVSLASFSTMQQCKRTVKQPEDLQSRKSICNSKQGPLSP